jgi:hypothetical protein
MTLGLCWLCVVDTPNPRRTAVLVSAAWAFLPDLVYSSPLSFPRIVLIPSVGYAEIWLPHVAVSHRGGLTPSRLLGLSTPGVDQARDLANRELRMVALRTGGYLLCRWMVTVFMHKWGCIVPHRPSTCPPRFLVLISSSWDAVVSMGELSCVVGTSAAWVSIVLIA